ncbi:hypothetical protein HELRODRAFT_115024 [Helobdella robusta]|uniref:Sec1 family domain-containing protein 1 n=1 Tax=Helobdella robusta TaxID=6412 RepID=T1EG59_HELRO|nr:hypothetical protein HELRODRAFT_115024 [Helobdella robusta]ESN94842.1 hypothetical protein HELRODRAFT_115024 [Helobdella robusta]
MLNFNNPITKSTISEPQWKILVYDKYGQSVISPLLNVKELRDLGVTVHLLLDSDREQIQDTPAIYFVMPTDENIKKICKDFLNQLYESYYLNFISAITRQRLEDIALGAIQANVVGQVSKVFDQYMNFITLEEDLFTLNTPQNDVISYYSINRGDVKDTEIEFMMDNIVDSLFSVCVTLGSIPVIRCAHGNAAEMVAEKLDKKLRENLRDTRNSPFSGEGAQVGSFSFQRPMLVILDRNFDLATPMHHTWTYQALAHDVLDYSSNRIELFETPDSRSQQAANKVPVHRKKKEYEMTIADKFWQSHKGSPFPRVAEAVQEELESYKLQEDEVRRLKSVMGLEGEDDATISMLSEGTAKLTSAISSLPELLERKRLIDMHMNIATAILSHIKARKLDVYFEMEEKLMSKSALDKTIADIISDPEAGTPEDKVRLFIISIICGQNMPESEYKEMCRVLESSGCQLPAIQYINRWKALYSKSSSLASTYTGGGTKTESMFTKLMSQASQFAMEGVKNLVVKKHKLPITKIVDGLMECRSEMDEYAYFDPKLLRPSDNTTTRIRSPFHEAIVFVVGGGSYIEYQNLVEYAKGKSGVGLTNRRITYGSTQLLNATQFLTQVSVFIFPVFEF